MDRETLQKLEDLNQLALTDAQKEDVLAFFVSREADLAKLDTIPTENVERMVHVRPMVNVLRDDVASQPFAREDLLAGAPEEMDDYWVVPRLVG